MAQIYDERLGRPEDAVAAYKKVLELDPGSERALKALDDLFTRQKMWSELAENLEAQLALAASDEGAARADAPPRRAARRRDGAGRRRHRGVPAGARARADQRRRPSRRSSGSGRTPKYELTIADLLEPLYRHIGDWQKLIGVHEVQVRRSEDVDPAGRAPPPDRAALRGLRRRPRAPAFATLARALKEDPANEATQQQLDRVARATGRFDDLLASSRSSPARSTTPTLASALYMTSARVQENDLGNVDTAIALYRKVLEIDPLSLARGRVARAPLPRRPSATRSSRIILQRKSEILEEPLDKKDALFQAAAIEEDVLNRSEAAIAVYSKVLEIDGDDLRAIDALIRRYLDLSRWQDLLGVYAQEGRSRRRRRGEEGHLLPGRRGLRARARRRAARHRHVHARSSSSIPTTCRRSRVSTSSTSRRRTGRSSSRC